MELYLPEKYKVILGSGEHIGLCTVWSDPNIVVRQVPQLLDACAIIGTLYSKEGVNIILRNLCLNPQIAYILIWGKGQLSQTPTGKSGWNILDSIWKNGISSEGIVNEANYKLHGNMDFAVINKLVHNVQLIDVSHLELQQVLEVAAKLEKKLAYMDPVSFPVYQRETDGPLPSEEVGWIVRGRTTVDAWIKAVDRIVRYGKITTKDVSETIKDLSVLTWVIENEDAQNPYIPEDWPKELKSIIGVESKEHIQSYIKDVFFNTKLPEGTTYIYGERLRSYPTGDGNLVNQVKYIIEKLKECNTTRRAVATLWYPPVDQGEKSPPCITQIQALQIAGKLHLFVTVRSHDMFKAALLNAFGLRTVQEEIAKATGLETGKLSITSTSAHIYEDDWDNAKKLAQCAIWERPLDLIFRVSDIDPRGIVLIRIENEKLVAEVMTRESELIVKIEGNTANEVCIKLSNLDLLSQVRHYTDISRQLQKAEIARDLGINFEQDKPLEIYSKNYDKEVITAFN